jgi:cytochrome c-type biogenesis protein
MTNDITIAFSFAAGIATFFSPCVFALLPGYVGYYVGSVEGADPPLSGALIRGIAASLGALGTFALLSVAALGATEVFERALPVIEPLVGLLLIALGIALVRSGSFSLHLALPERRSSVLGFAGFGAVYAFAATACVLPLFLSVTVASVGLSVTQTMFVLGAYASAFAVLMVAATVAIAVGRDAALGLVAGRATLLSRAAGLVLILAGFLQLYLAFFVPSINPLG